MMVTSVIEGQKMAKRRKRGEKLSIKHCRMNKTSPTKNMLFL
jgi:hypothetical protein